MRSIKMLGNTMSPSEVLESIYSGDNHEAWKAAWEIIRTKNTLLDQYYLPELEDLRKAINSLPKPEVPALRDSRDCVKLALAILEARQHGVCRCSTYLTTDQVLPESQEKYLMVRILDKRDIPWEPEFDCQCTDCGKIYLVKENHGYHYPWSSWQQKNA